MRPLLVLFFSTISLPALAWGPEGHSLVARIAEAQLTPAARARVAQILGPGKTMASVASVADDIRSVRRETAVWHFVDIPIDTARFDPERDCAKGDCVVSRISRFIGVLRDPGVSADDRREALEFVIHFVGDLHQPLHSSDNHDRGGNDVPVQFRDRPTNLHSLWDSGILSRLGPENQVFPSLRQDAAKRRGKWAKGNVTAWAEEAHKAGRKTAYGKLPKPAPGMPIVIDAPYENSAIPVLRQQIERAGVRLAFLLNAEFR